MQRVESRTRFAQTRFDRVGLLVAIDQRAERFALQTRPRAGLTRMESFVHDVVAHVSDCLLSSVSAHFHLSQFRDRGKFCMTVAFVSDKLGRPDCVYGAFCDKQNEAADRRHQDKQNQKRKTPLLKCDVFRFQDKLHVMHFIQYI